MTENRSINLAVIAGDGIGPEVVAQAERVLLDSQSKSWLQFAISAVRYVVEFLNRA